MSKTMMQQTLEALDRAAEVMARECGDGPEDVERERLEYTVEVMADMLHEAWGQLDLTGQRAVLACRAVGQMLEHDPKQKRREADPGGRGDEPRLERNPPRRAALEQG